MGKIKELIEIVQISEKLIIRLISLIGWLAILLMILKDLISKLS